MPHSNGPQKLSLALLAVGLMTLVAAAPEPSPSSFGTCFEAVLPITVSAGNYVYDIVTPRAQPEITNLFTRVTSHNSNITGMPNRVFLNNATYNVFTQLCVPKNGEQDAAKTVELAIHSGNFDHTYWTFGGPGSRYNYMETALKAGRSVLVYDRIGVGKSAKPDPIKEVQYATQVEIAAELVKYLKGTPQGTQGLQFNRFIGVGHSIGSVILTAMAGKYGNLLDATVLTSFAAKGFNYGGVPAHWTVAADYDRRRFGSLPPSYVVYGGPIADQNNFFCWPYYDPAVLVQLEEHRGPVPLGEILGLPTAVSLVEKYTNPLLVTLGDKDYVFCAGNCYQAEEGSDRNAFVGMTQSLFPNVQSYTTVFSANASHAPNLHFSAPDLFVAIGDWITNL